MPNDAAERAVKRIMDKLWKVTPDERTTMADIIREEIARPPEPEPKRFARIQIVSDFEGKPGTITYIDGSAIVTADQLEELWRDGDWSMLCLAASKLRAAGVTDAALGRSEAK